MNWRFFEEALALSSTHLSIALTSITWPHGWTSTNLALWLPSFPNRFCVTSSLSHTRHFFGQGSPHMPIQRWRHFLNGFLLHGFSHRGLSQGSLHSFVHLRCWHFQLHGFVQGIQGSLHFFLQIPWAHLLSHFFWHGGQFLAHTSGQLWPHNSVWSHFTWQGLWRRPNKHWLQFPTFKIRITNMDIKEFSHKKTILNYRECFPITGKFCSFTLIFLIEKLKKSFSREWKAYWNDKPKRTN